jgi:predicted NUDIX family NTP pyrophosphohydrolase
MESLTQVAQRIFGAVYDPPEHLWLTVLFSPSKAGQAAGLEFLNPKGEYSQGEEALTVAKREFEEETGACPHGDFLPLGEVVQPGRKIVTAWGLEGDFDPATLTSNRFELEWPPRSGRKASFPEVDRARWFSPADARRKILAAQSEFITRLLAAIGK